MAEKKPEPKKASAGGGGGGGVFSLSDDNMFALEMKILAVIAFVIIIYLAIGKTVLQDLGLNQNGFFDHISNIINQGLDSFNYIFNLIIFVSVFLILLFVLGSYYLKHLTKEIVQLYKTSLPKGFISSSSVTVGSQSSDALYGKELGKTKPVLNDGGENKKWIDIEKHMASMNSSEWRMAILEADILLYEMLEQMGYHGDTIADKLKSIESSDFNTLDLAWRAHKVRNTIAHEGSSYELSHQQAQNTIDLYRKVFEEFYFI